MPERDRVYLSKENMKLRFNGQALLSYATIVLAASPQILRYAAMTFPAASIYLLPLAKIVEKMVTLDNPIDPIPYQASLGFLGAIGLHGVEVKKK